MMKKTSVQVRNSNSRRSKQPLKSTAPGLRASLSTGAICLLLGGLLLANFEQIDQFVNRPVSKVRMENQWQRVDQREVRAALSSALGTGFFSFDVGAVRTSLEALPWVEKATVMRIWPDTLSLRIEEEVPIARWGKSGVLNQAGKILYPGTVDSLQSLPLLEGPEGTQLQVMRQYQQLNEVLFPAGFRLSALSLSQRSSWSLLVNDNIDVVVGREKILQRVKRFVSFYGARADLQEAMIASVDLRYDNGVAIAFENPEFSGVASR